MKTDPHRKENPFAAVCPVCGRPGESGRSCAWCGEDVPDRGRVAQRLAYVLLAGVCLALDFGANGAVSHADAIAGMALATLAVPFFLPKTRLGEIFPPRALGGMLFLFAAVRFCVALCGAPALPETALRVCLACAALWGVADVPELPPIPTHRTALGRLCEAYARPFPVILAAVLAAFVPTPALWLPAALATHRKSCLALALVLLAFC